MSDWIKMKWPKPVTSFLKGIFYWPFRSSPPKHRSKWSGLHPFEDILVALIVFMHLLLRGMLDRDYAPLSEWEANGMLPTGISKMQSIMKNARMRTVLHKCADQCIQYDDPGIFAGPIKYTVLLYHSEAW